MKARGEGVAKIRTRLFIACLPKNAPGEVLGQTKVFFSCSKGFTTEREGIMCAVYPSLGKKKIPSTRDQQDERIRKLEKAVDILLRRSNIAVNDEGELMPASPTKRVIGY